MFGWDPKLAVILIVTAIVCALLIVSSFELPAIIFGRDE